MKVLRIRAIEPISFLTILFSVKPFSTRKEPSVPWKTFSCWLFQTAWKRTFICKSESEIHQISWILWVCSSSLMCLSRTVRFLLCDLSCCNRVYRGSRRNNWCQVSQTSRMGMKITMGTDSWACKNKDYAMEPECEGGDIAVWERRREIRAVAAVVSWFFSWDAAERPGIYKPRGFC